MPPNAATGRHLAGWSKISSGPSMPRPTAGLNNHAEAQELCQDVFLQAMRKIDQLDDPRCFGGWLRSIADRMAINRMMRRGPMHLGRHRHAEFRLRRTPHAPGGPAPARAPRPGPPRLCAASAHGSRNAGSLLFRRPIDHRDVEKIRNARSAPSSAACTSPENAWPRNSNRSRRREVPPLYLWERGRG